MNIAGNLKCNLCLSNIDKYKSNSHVIPRWMIVEFTKANGRNVLIEKSESSSYNIKERNQQDLMFDFVCDNCERR